MPLHEFRCDACRRRFTLLIGMTAEAARRECPRCGGTSLQRLISRFAVGRSEEALLDDLEDPASLGDPEDPKAMAQWMRRVGREMGEDLGDDFDALVEDAVQESVDSPAAADSGAEA